MVTMAAVAAVTEGTMKAAALAPVDNAEGFSADRGRGLELLE